MINLKLDDELGLLFNVVCADKDVTMRDEFIYLITRDIEQYKKAKKAK